MDLWWLATIFCTIVMGRGIMIRPHPGEYFDDRRNTLVVRAKLLREKPQIGYVWIAR
jgi:hypothetical protein